jgi:hypothetical protein
LLNEDRGNDFTTRLVSFDPQEIKDSYQIQPFGLPSNNDNVVSTIQMYKDYFDLHIGMYCQEFAVDQAAVQLLAQLVNEHPDIYDLGLSWGGVNGILPFTAFVWDDLPRRTAFGINGILGKHGTGI